MIFQLRKDEPTSYRDYVSILMEEMKEKTTNFLKFYTEHVLRKKLDYDISNRIFDSNDNGFSSQSNIVSLLSEDIELVGSLINTLFLKGLISLKSLLFSC
jgi:hypothetical protein